MRPMTEHKTDLTPLTDEDFAKITKYLKWWTQTDDFGATVKQSQQGRNMAFQKELKQSRMSPEELSRIIHWVEPERVPHLESWPEESEEASRHIVQTVQVGNTRHGTVGDILVGKDSLRMTGLGVPVA